MGIEMIFPLQETSLRGEEALHQEKEVLLREEEALHLLLRILDALDHVLLPDIQKFENIENLALLDALVLLDEAIVVLVHVPIQDLVVTPIEVVLVLVNAVLILDRIREIIIEVLVAVDLLPLAKEDSLVLAHLLVNANAIAIVLTIELLPCLFLQVTLDEKNKDVMD